MMEHQFGNWACLRCGQTWENVLDGIAPKECQPAIDVVPVTEKIMNRWYNENIAPVTGRYIKNA